MQTLKLFTISLLITTTFVACEKEELIGAPETNESKLKSSSSYQLNNWMGSLNDNLLLSELSIPGTHQSCAQHENWPGTAKCQEISLNDQLNIGVRFLDIRCRHYKDAFVLHHGAVYQKYNFNDVLKECWDFLKNNPSECIIMSIKEEHDPHNNTRSYEETFDTYVKKNPEGWELSASISSLGDVRGKIVLFRRFNIKKGTKGIKANYKWKDNTTFSINTSYSSLRIQDYYKVDNKSKKWDSITALFDDATSGANDVLHVNFSSGYSPGIFGIPDIPEISDYINPKLISYFENNTSGRYGSVLMDFVSEENCSLIVATNF